jgi:hypothetical protein
MCTRANSASVSDSFHAVISSLVAVAAAVLALVLAVATAPWRAATSQPAGHGKPASTAHIAIQVHLDDGGRVRAIERSCRDALKRAARTWAPFPLPLDRVEVISSAPPLGKSDIFEQWATTTTSSGDAGMARLVVVSIGTTVDGRQLASDEIGGALAAQIEKLVIDRYRREHPQPTAVTASEPDALPLRVRELEPLVGLAADRESASNVTDLTSVRALLADIKKGQPLAPAGLSRNGVHLEPDPAS